MVNPQISVYMAEIGRKGGKKSRRLDSEAARTMVRVREAQKAFREFHNLCFWSSPPDYRVKKGDLDWIVDQLKPHGAVPDGTVAIVYAVNPLISQR